MSARGGFRSPVPALSLSSTLSIPETAKPPQHSANSRFRGFFHLSCLGPHAKTAHSLVTCITAGAACIYAWNTVETGSGCNVTCAGERTVRSLGEWIKSSFEAVKKSKNRGQTALFAPDSCVFSNGCGARKRCLAPVFRFFHSFFPPELGPVVLLLETSLPCPRPNSSPVPTTITHPITLYQRNEMPVN